jgi:hypothetical protein
MPSEWPPGDDPQFIDEVNNPQCISLTLGRKNTGSIIRLGENCLWLSKNEPVRLDSIALYRDTFYPGWDIGPASFCYGDE